jgi:hypothetical protein
MMCSEENPAICHRHLLIARVLSADGVRIAHIRGDGQIESYQDVERKREGGKGQRLLFGEMEKDSWKSLQSICLDLSKG